MACWSTYAVNSGGNGNSNPRPQRKRGHPDPGAKIIALTLEDLKYSNSSNCDLCAVEFPRKPNPATRVRRSRRRVKSSKPNKNSLRPTAYICPVPTCRHHDRRRALSDVTAVKKHYGRAHCPKKLKCTRCDKKYAIGADLRAHFKFHLKDAGVESSNHAANRRSVRRVAPAVDAGVNEHGGGSDNNGIGKQQEIYVQQFGVAPDQFGCAALGYPKAPIGASFVDLTVATASAAANYDPFLSNPDGHRMSHMPMMPSTGNYYFPAGIPNQQGMSARNTSLYSYAPFFGSGAVPANTDGHSMGVGGSSDGYNGLFVGTRGSELGINGVGSFPPASEQMGRGAPPLAASELENQRSSGPVCVLRNFFPGAEGPF